MSSSGAGWPLQTGHFSALLGLEKAQREFPTFHAGNQQKLGTGKLLTGGTLELGGVRMSWNSHSSLVHWREGTGAPGAGGSERAGTEPPSLSWQGLEREGMSGRDQPPLG